MELRRECLVNLGFGMPDGVASVAGEEGVAGEMTLSIESGTLGGVPAPGNGLRRLRRRGGHCQAHRDFRRL